MSGASMRVFRLLALLTVIAGRAWAAEPVPKPPDRRELWVPADKLARVLDRKAVLLSREQYETLLRDAGLEKPVKPEAPAGAVLSSGVFHAVPDGKTAVIRAELIVNVLRDGWSELPLDVQGAAIGEMKFDGEGVIVPRNALLRADVMNVKGKMLPPRPAMLVVRGRGQHRLSMELSTPIQNADGINSFALTAPNVASGAFTLALPAGATMEKSDLALRVHTTADATIATAALSPAGRTIGFAWKNAAVAGDARVPVRAQAKVRYSLDAEKISAIFRVRLDAALGDLPVAFEFALPPEVKILRVHADELRGWEAAGGKVSVTFQPGARKSLELDIDAELSALSGKDLATVVLPLPVLKGVPRLDGILFVSAGDDVIVKDVALDAALRRVPTAEDRGERGFFGAFEFSGRATGPRVTMERALPRLEADLDTLVEFRSDAIFLTRTVALREEKGHRFSAAITLPKQEELLEVRRIEDGGKECEPEWTREAGTVMIKWSDESAKPRVFRLRSRVEPEKWTQLPAEGTTFILGDAKVADAAKLAGYIALVADPAFRLEAQPGEMLERRDGRNTPVRGDYAWFRRDAFDLKVKIVRRPAEVLAALTGYLLPLEGVLDIHASMNYQFMGGGTRAVRIRVPADLAQNFHFEGPQIAERALDGDVWTITFQKELTGEYALGITAQVPVAKQADAGGDGAKGYSFAVKVPVITPLDVVRASGLWAVEANTETEIRFDATGMNELDSLLAPKIADYAPRHRVIGVFGWLGAEYALALNGVRHAAAGMLTAVVDVLELNTVISTSGLHRHEAMYRLRVAGVAYLDVALPEGAQLLSVAVDGHAVKPVAARLGSVRLPLPARRDADAAIMAAFVYETPGLAWKNRGTLALAAPVIAKEIPVLKSTWRVWVPNGFSVSDFESNLPVPEVLPEELLVRRLGRIAVAVVGAPFLPVFSEARRESRETALAEQSEFTVRERNDELSRSAAAGPATSFPAMTVVDGRKEEQDRDRFKFDDKVSAPVTAAITRKLNSIIFPKIDFRDTTVREAVDFIVKKSKDLDPEAEGVNIVLKLGDEGEGGGRTRITLTLNNVPLLEVLKYVTNLANLKYRIDPFAVAIVPLGTVTEDLVTRQWKISPSLLRSLQSGNGQTGLGAKEILKAHGVDFGQGTIAMYDGASSSLLVKNTQEQLDLVSQILDSGGDKPAPAKPGSPIAAKPKSATGSVFDHAGVQKTAGLLPVTLDLPKNGRALVFGGLYAPERLAMRYDGWWSRAQRLWLWFVAGGIVFYFLARGRPWWRTLWAALVLSAVPLCVSIAWMPVCNALLGGWIVALVLNRIGAWFVFRAPKEVLA